VKTQASQLETRTDDQEDQTDAAEAEDTKPPVTVVKGDTSIKIWGTLSSRRCGQSVALPLRKDQPTRSTSKLSAISRTLYAERLTRGNGRFIRVTVMYRSSD
jgi:hypothetical protein